jgi:hypothetical protein
MDEITSKNIWLQAPSQTTYLTPAAWFLAAWSVLCMLPSAVSSAKPAVCVDMFAHKTTCLPIRVYVGLHQRSLAQPSRAQALSLQPFPPHCGPSPLLNPFPCPRVQRSHDDSHHQGVHAQKHGVHVPNEGQYHSSKTNQIYIRWLTIKSLLLRVSYSG